MSSHAEIMIALLCEGNGAMKFSRDPKRSPLKKDARPSSIIQLKHLMRYRKNTLLSWRVQI
jgi:hypothetical protein